MLCHRSHQLPSCFFILLLFFSCEWIISKFLSSSSQILSSASSILRLMLSIIFFFISSIIFFSSRIVWFFSYDFYLFVKLNILFVYCFPDLIKLCFLCSLSILQTAIWILYWYITDHHVFGISYWKIIVILWWCHVSLTFHVPGSSALLSSHLK